MNLKKKSSNIADLGITNNIVDRTVCENTLVIERNTPVLNPTVTPI